MVALAEVLGHAKLDTVMVYAHMAKMITEEGYRAKWLGGSDDSKGGICHERNTSLESVPTV